MTRLRLGLALAGFAAALLAIAFEERRLGWVAIGCLAASFLIRLTQPAPVPPERPVTLLTWSGTGLA